MSRSSEAPLRPDSPLPVGPLHLMTFATGGTRPGGSDSKEFTCLVKTWIQSLGWEDPLEEDMGIHILAWRIPWTVQPDGLQSMGSQRVRHSLATNPPPGVPSHLFLGRNSPTQVAF